MASKWARREKYIMEKLGLKPQPGSGSGWLHKEDGENDEVLAQLKSTDCKGISVTRQIWYDTWKHARQSHKVPVLVLDFLDPDGELLIVCRPKDLDTVSKSLNTEV